MLGLERLRQLGKNVNSVFQMPEPSQEFVAYLKNTDLRNNPDILLSDNDYVFGHFYGKKRTRRGTIEESGRIIVRRSILGQPPLAERSYHLKRITQGDESKMILTYEGLYPLSD